MSKDGIVFLLMILNVNTYANVILERSLRRGALGFSVLDIFFHRFFGFCVKRRRFFGFGVQCGLKIFFF